MHLSACNINRNMHHCCLFVNLEFVALRSHEGERDLEHRALRGLLDESACRALLMRYGLAIDWRDRSALERLFWPDAAVDLGFFKGSGAEAPAFLIENANLSLRRCHITTNSCLRFDGDVVFGDSCAITHAVSRTDGQELWSHLFFGRYIDRLERRGAEWRFAARRYLLHGAKSAPYAEDAALSPLTRADDLGPDHPLFDLP